MSTPVNPAPARMVRTRSGSLKAKGPGACGSAGGGRGGTWARAAAIGTRIQSLKPSGRQQTKASRPPGLSALRMLAKAAVGSAKNITPKRE